MHKIFLEKRKKDYKLVEPETNAKYKCLVINFVFDHLTLRVVLFMFFCILQAKIKKLVQYDSSLTDIEVV